MQVKCAIVDDNSSDLKTLESCIRKCSFETSVSFDIQQFSLPSDPKIMENHFSLYILDIDMPEMTGFELATLLFKVNPKTTVMFCTQHDQLVFESLKMNAFYFIRKSFLQEDLEAALRKFIYTYLRDYTEYVIKSSNGITVIPLSEITYFESLHNDLLIHTNKKTYKERKTLSQVIQEIPSDLFLRINKSQIVNTQFIRSFDGESVLLTTDEKLYIPRRSIREIKEKFLRLHMR